MKSGRITSTDTPASLRTLVSVWQGDRRGYSFLSRPKVLRVPSRGKPILQVPVVDALVVNSEEFADNHDKARILWSPSFPRWQIPARRHYYNREEILGEPIIEREIVTVALPAPIDLKRWRLGIILVRLVDNADSPRINYQRYILAAPSGMLMLTPSRSESANYTLRRNVFFSTAFPTSRLASDCSV